MKPVAQHGVKNGIITLKTEFIMIQIDRETFQMMLHQIMERFDRIDDRLNRMNRQTAALEGEDRKSTRLNSSHIEESRMPSSA